MVGFCWQAVVIIIIIAFKWRSVSFLSFKCIPLSPHLILGDPETLPETQASRHPLKTRQMLDTPPDNVQHPSDYQNIARVQNCPEITILNLLFWSFSLFVAWSFCLFICLSFCHFVLCFEENCPRYCHQPFLNEIAREMLKYFETLFWDISWTFV